MSKKLFKALALCLALAMVLSLAACTGNNTSSTSSESSTSSQTESSSQAESSSEAEATPEPVKEVLNQIIYGTTTELSGDLGNAWWTNNAADATVRELIDDYSVIVTDQGGEFVVNETVSSGVDAVENEDGSKTYTVHINDGLKYNNGDPITAADFVARALVAYSPAAKEAGAKNQAGANQILGGVAYMNGETNVLEGVHYIDDNTYSITILKEDADGNVYLPYYYEQTYASLYPLALKMYASAPLTVKDDGEGAYLDGGELVASEIDAARWIYADRISAGPYTLVDLDLGNLTATLKINENYGGNFEGVKPEVETLIVVKAVQETMMDELKTGSIDFLGTLTDGDQVNVALDLEETGDFTTVSYNRNGYGKLLFQCDFGPTQFKAVRHAVAYLLDRNDFANQFCQGFGSVVHGPYGISMWMYQESQEELAERLDTYAYNVDEAIRILEEDGWTLNEDGTEYAGTGIRWKEVTAEEAGEYEHNVTLDDGRILMPLIIEWSSSEGNSVSELLAVMLANGEQTAQAGMQINQHVMSFDDLLNYMYRDATQGEQYGVPTYGMYNLATNFNATYDLSYNYTMDPELVAMGYNVNFTQDELLDKLSMDMVYGVEAGDSETYRQIWVDFIDEWNDYLPEVPLYSNVYYDAMNAKIHDLECNPLWNFQQAIVYAYIE